MPQLTSTAVFVNWAKLACIIGRMLDEEEISYLYYFGDMTKQQKEAAIPEFQDNPDVKVMASHSLYLPLRHRTDNILDRLHPLRRPSPQSDLRQPRHPRRP